jgi:hypothetical protein
MLDPMDPMDPGATAESEQRDGEPVYLSCTAEDLIVVEMEAWRRGYQAATTDAAAALQSLEAVAEAGEGACNQALSLYVPLDIARFADVFVRAWCGGYCTRAREFKPLAAPPITH